MRKMASKTFLNESRGRILGSQISWGLQNEGSIPPSVETAFIILYSQHFVRKQMNSLPAFLL
jgi:hypothetical protein